MFFSPPFSVICDLFNAPLHLHLSLSLSLVFFQLQRCQLFATLWASLATLSLVACMFCLPHCGRAAHFREFVYLSEAVTFWFNCTGSPLSKTLSAWTSLLEQTDHIAYDLMPSNKDTVIPEWHYYRLAANSVKAHLLQVNRLSYSVHSLVSRSQILFFMIDSSCYVIPRAPPFRIDREQRY